MLLVGVFTNKIETEDKVIFAYNKCHLPGNGRVSIRVQDPKVRGKQSKWRALLVSSNIINMHVDSMEATSSPIQHGLDSMVSFHHH